MWMEYVQKDVVLVSVVLELLLVQILLPELGAVKVLERVQIQRLVVFIVTIFLLRVVEVWEER